MLAARLGLDYVDSGATYRAAALKVLESGIEPEDEPAVADAIGTAEIRFATDPSGSRVFLDGQDVTAKIRTAAVTLTAAKVSRLPAVRRKLLAVQRTLARDPGVVMEGRDIGTVVFPDAPLKIFLKADPEERARRRHHEDQHEGRSTTVEQTAYEIGRRDQLDAERKISPLVAAPDAVEIDSTLISAEQVVERIVELARKLSIAD